MDYYNRDINVSKHFVSMLSILLRPITLKRTKSADHASAFITEADDSLSTDWVFVEQADG